MITRRRWIVLAGGPLAGQSRLADAEKLGPYFPTPDKVVERMLTLGELKRGEKMFDLGSGDGRIVIMAAEKFGADATGVELDEKLHRESSARIRTMKLENRARIVLGDVLKHDYSSADLVTVYLLPKGCEMLKPILERQLKKGARVVSHDFEFPGWTPVKIDSREDSDDTWPHTLYLYRR
jgi:16S rRNA A1518/A1519 N6-dimethyltransferase RsmA/KsgA/DIM1 with predicted DNA glycosylase/AP lyase activity